VCLSGSAARRGCGCWVTGWKYLCVSLLAAFGLWSLSASSRARCASLRTNRVCVCVCVCVCVYVCVYLYIYTYIYTYKYNIYIYIYTLTYTFLHILLYIYVFTYTYIYIYYRVGERTLLSGCAQGKIILWDVDSQEALFSTMAHAGAVMTIGLLQLSVRGLASGCVIAASAGEDATIKIWQVIHTYTITHTQSHTHMSTRNPSSLCRSLPRLARTPISNLAGDG